MTTILTYLDNRKKFVGYVQVFMNQGSQILQATLNLKAMKHGE